MSFIQELTYLKLTTSTYELYEVSGTKWNNKWKYVIEKETGKLWVEIIYK